MPLPNEKVRERKEKIQDITYKARHRLQYYRHKYKDIKAFEYTIFDNFFGVFCHCYDLNRQREREA